MNQDQWERLVTRLEEKVEVEFFPEERSRLAEGIEEIKEGVGFTTPNGIFKLV